MHEKIIDALICVFYAIVLAVLIKYRFITYTWGEILTSKQYWILLFIHIPPLYAYIVSRVPETESWVQNKVMFALCMLIWYFILSLVFIICYLVFDIDIVSFIMN